MISAEKIPNNVNLSSNKRLQRALEHWQPKYIQWWRDMGPQGFQDYHQVYVRTAISVDPEGWAHFEYVKLPEYRWGIFLADPVHDRRIGFGDFFGQPVWQEVPGEFRNQLRRLIVTQGDTEPASVEQQRLLGQRCPSLYDLRNLFQVNVEEGRHLWAMVYLLHSYFGRDGRDEAEELLERQSGNRDKPRILEAFNEPIDNWLDFFMFTMFTDRDGKSQLMSLSESSLDPLSRTTRFMLTEEAHHMFVGETGIARILERTCQLMKQAGFSEDVRKLGGIDIPTIQKHLNQWFSLSLDLHGSEVSSNAASYFANGLKGRAKEDTFDEHVVEERVLQHGVLRGRQAGDEGNPDAQRDERGAARLVRRRLRGRRRRAGTASSNSTACPIGCGCRIASSTAASACTRASISIRTACRCRKRSGRQRKYDWLPSAADTEYLLSIMAEPVYEPGKFANYIAPPRRGINQLPIDFEYVRTER